MQGIVKWFNATKGFGFITPTGGDRDVFVHHSDIQGSRTLGTGDKVEYEVAESEKGPKAVNVRLVE